MDPIEWRPRGVRTGRSMVAALGAAVVAFVAAVFVAVGPADTSQAEYRWPAPQPEAGSLAPSGADGRRMLFAPLMLSRRSPARLSVDVSCAVVQATATPVASEPLTLFASASNASSSGMGLVIEGEKVRLAVGDAVLAETPWSSGTLADPDCMVSAAFRGEKWRLRVGDQEHRGNGDRAPFVNGLFTELPRPVRGEPGLSVRVTAVAGSSPSVRQVVLTVVSVMAGTVGLALLLRKRAGRCPRVRMCFGAAAAAARRGAGKVALVDAVVFASLGAWWFFGPVIYDDGWELATVLNFPKSGAFTNYYGFADVPYPLGFLRFLFHFASSRVSTSLLWMRLPVLVVGLVTWALLRWYLAQVGAHSRTARAGSQFALASVFLLAWFAWLNTLRPEPFVALVSVIVLVAMLRFSQSSALGYLVLAVLAAAVAVSLHPAGVVAIAPLLAAVPSVWRWRRERGLLGLFALVAIGLIAAGALILLVMADTDLEKWRQSRDFFATSEVNQLSWRDEFHRYGLLFGPGLYSPVVRRGSVVFGLVAAVLFVTRPVRRRDAEFNLAMMSLAVGVLLMAFTPSKWPFQLGALGGFAALAMATELRRLGLETAGSASRNWRSMLVLGATVVASAIAWRGSADFGPFTVLDVDFGRGGSEFLGVNLSSPLPWLVIAAGAFVACAVVAALRRRLTARAVVDRWLGLSGIWAIPVAVGVVVAATLGLFVADAVERSPGWSLPRQNYEDLTGQTCGMGDDIGVADPTRSTPLEPDPLRAEKVETGDLPDATQMAPLEFAADGSPSSPPDVDLENRWGSRISGNRDTGVFSSPWFVTGPDATTERLDRPGLALFTAGRPSASGNRLFVQFGRRDTQTIDPLGVQRLTAPDSGTWEALAIKPPRATTHVRVIALDADPSPDGWLAFSAPRRVRYQRLSALLGEPRVTTLMGPEFRMYFPCVTNPPITRGVTRPPDYNFEGPGGVGALGALSPMAGIVDLYPSQPLLTRTAGGISIRNFFTIERIVKQPGPGTLTPFDRSQRSSV